jgi:pimeloyl-ACP methyl ester carboxylesterase
MAGMQRDPAMQARFEQFRTMMATVARSKGMSAVIDAMRGSPQWASRAGGEVPAALRRHVEGMRDMSVDGYLGGAAAMQGWSGTLDRLQTIAVPTLVLVGEDDNLLPASKTIAAKVEGRRFVLLRNCGTGATCGVPTRGCRRRPHSSTTLKPAARCRATLRCDRHAARRRLARLDRVAT